MSSSTTNDLIRVENPLASLISKEELLEACPNLYDFLSGILSRTDGVYDIVFSDGGGEGTNNILVTIKSIKGIFKSGFTVAKGTFDLIPADNSYLLPLNILGDGLYVGLASIVLNLSKGYGKGLIVNVSRKGFKFNMIKLRSEDTTLVREEHNKEPKEEQKPNNTEKVKQPKSYENLDVRLRFAKALRAEVEGNLGDKITKLYDSQSLKESIKLLAASYTEDKEFILRMHNIQLPSTKGVEYTGYYGIVMKDSKKAKTLAYVSEETGAHFNEDVIKEPMPEVLKNGFEGMLGIAKYTDGSVKVTFNVKITDKAILIDITQQSSSTLQSSKIGRRC